MTNRHYNRIYRRRLARVGNITLFDYTPQYSYDGTNWKAYAEGVKRTKDAAFNVILQHSYRSQTKSNKNWKYEGLVGD